MDKKIILHIPHSSIIFPMIDGFIADKATLDKEVLKLTDWYTDDLFHSAFDDMIIADFSRIFCDPERFTDDTQEIMAQYGMGVLYEKSDEGEIIRNITPDLRERILNEYYWKHHNRLNQAVSKQLKLYGKVLIIDCHSFKNSPLKRNLNQEINRPDFNIGTDSFHTPQKLIDISVDFFNKLGYSLGIDWPSSGSIVLKSKRTWSLCI
jgi:N-formylglutamate amidohydrolase